MMWTWINTYEVSGKIQEDALKEWQKLDKTIQQQFAKKLKKSAVTIRIFLPQNCAG